LADASQKSATLWIASGPQLLKLTLPAGSASAEAGSLIPEKIPSSSAPFPTPLRSIRATEIAAQPTLLLGAQNSVIRLDPALSEQSVCYHDEPIPRQMGFNSAVILDDTLWAAHSEAGLIAWAIDQPNTPLRALRSDHLQQQTRAASARPGNLIGLDDQRALFALGPSLLLLTADGTITPVPHLSPEGEATIVAILDEHETIAILHADGQLLRLHRSTLDIAARQRPTGQIASATSLPWMGTIRLLLATAEGPIHCIGRDDPLITRYLSPHRALPILAATSGWIAAVSSDRQRLILWNTWDTAKPALDFPITPQTRHRIADIVFAK
jgi:hypothetical protein